MASQTGSIDLKGLNVAGSVQQYFWSDNDGVHVTQIPQDEYLADPSNAGINILINSTNGLQILDGTTVLAFYSISELIGDPEGAHVEITSEGVTITSPDGIAFSVQQGAGSSQIQVVKNIRESTTTFPHTFVIPELSDAVSGTSVLFRYRESDTTSSYKQLSFTKGTAQTQSTTHGTVLYDGATSFTVNNTTNYFTAVAVLYYATEIVPQINMQGEAIVIGSLSVNGNIINETVIEQGSAYDNRGTWFYRKWSSGMVEAWYNMDTAISVNFNSSSSVAGTYRKDTTITIPSGIFSSKPNFGIVNVQQDSTTIHGEFHPVSSTSGTVYWTRDATGTANITASIYIVRIPEKLL